MLNVLLDHAFQHFHDEEGGFVKGPDCDQQCLKHYRMIKQLHGFIYDFRKNKKIEGRDPLTFLAGWFQEHIKQHKRSISPLGPLNLSLMKESDQIDYELKQKFKEKRRHRRVHYKDVVDGKIDVQCYNITRGKTGTATILDMSTSRLLLMTSSDVYNVDDQLTVTGKIGANFILKENVRVRRAENQLYGMEFIDPSPETKEFFTKLYGAVYMRRTTRLP